jgi:hypothetical protein
MHLCSVTKLHSIFDRLNTNMAAETGVLKFGIVPVGEVTGIFHY